MAEPVKPILQKPPGYRDPTVPARAPKSTQLPIRKPISRPPAYYPMKQRRSCCRICCCFFCSLIFILILLSLVSSGLFYLWFDPKLPEFHLQSFKIAKFNVAVKSDGTYLDSETTVRVEAKNPNGKIKFDYGGTRLTVTVEDDTELGTASRPGFTQRQKNTTSLKFTTRVKNVLVGDGVGQKLKARYRSRDLVVFTVVRTRIGLSMEGWRVGTVGIKVMCGDISLKKFESGSMPKCTINVLNWITITK